MLDKIKAFITEKPQYLIYAYFLIAAASLAYLLVYAIVPDEGVHYAAVEYYAKHTPSPFVGPQTGGFEAGELAKTGSFFYYYVLGFFYNLVDSVKLNPLVPLRMLSVLTSVGTLVFLYRIGTFLGVEKKIRLATLFLIANVPMFIFISAGVNYDALVIFLSVICAYTVLLISSRITLFRALVLLNIIIFGPMVKLAFGPISAAALLYFIVLLIKNHKHRLVHISNRAKMFDLFLIFTLTTTMLMGTSLFLSRYGSNYITYQKLNPECDQILSVEECSINFVYSRTQIYKNADLEEVEVRNQTYIPSWVELMTERTYGLLGHKVFVNNYVVINTGLALIYLLILGFIRKFRFDWKDFYIPFVSVAYIGALILTNIESFKKTQEVGLGIQGRYWFAVLFIFIYYVLSLHNKFLIKNSKRPAYSLVIAIVVVFSFYSGIPNIGQGVSRTWIRENLPLSK